MQRAAGGTDAAWSARSVAARSTAEGKELQLEGTASSSSCPRGARDVVERLLGTSERRAGGRGHWRATQVQGPPVCTRWGRGCERDAPMRTGM